MTSDFWTDRNVFVTGCTGLMGGWLTEALCDAGANVVGLIRDRVPRSRLVQNRLVDRINVVFGEMQDYLLLERALNEYQVDTVFHLAAQTIVGIANDNPLSTFEANIKGTWNLLEACRHSSRVKAVVVASSDKAYGEHEHLPYSEDAPLLGRHPYDVSKACADMLAQTFSNTYQLPVCITRFGNLFGGGDLNFDRLIPGTVRSVIRGEAPVIRSNGKFSRDYIYVEDAVQAYMLLAENMSADSAILGWAFNFSYESPLTALQVVEKILGQMGQTDLQPQILGTARNEIPHQYLSARNAREVLGWRPSFEFDEGLRRTVPWYQDSLGQENSP
jgi:CDP-glucose 4,6-dehydratase